MLTRKVLFGAATPRVTRKQDSLVGYCQFLPIIELPLWWLRKRGAAMNPTVWAAENREESPLFGPLVGRRGDRFVARTNNAKRLV
jgi:hypothetical protein